MTGVAIHGFSEATSAWFVANFGEPTIAQTRAWPAIAGGGHVLLCAPTGSGKTLAAFLAAIDRLASTAPDLDAKGVPVESTSVVYVSPLRALAVDVEKNLRAPIRGSMLAAQRLGIVLREPTVGVRTGDTPATDRRRLVAHPPDILITTPESLYLMLTSAARRTLASVTTVIIDEIHAVAATKRGSHLAVSLERLEHITDGAPQRIGLSATQRPLSEIAHFLGGNAVEVGSATVLGPRPVTIIDAGVRKPLDIEVIVPVEDMGRLGEEIDGDPGRMTGDGTRPEGVAALPRRSIWPAMHPRLLELVEQHHSTIIFTNARRLAERLSSRLNELADEQANRGGENYATPPAEGTELVRAHHGSLSRTQRLVIEDELKSGRLRGLVATSSLELGIDMGAVDLVVQVASPGSVASGLQRVGRAGHQVGAASRGRFFPKHRADLLETAVVVQRMYDGEIETTRFIRNPLDVLAQQIVAMCALDDWSLDELSTVIRSAAPYGELSGDLLAATLDLLDGRYPSDEFAELRPRIVWDRNDNTIRGRAGAQRVAVTNAGTIPDRGLFGVFLPDGARVGELDEEMVYESRVGETFLLGATTWRIEDITFERVVVTPAPGVPGKMPFWHGDGPGRPVELGRAIGQFTRSIRSMPRDAALDVLRDRHRLDVLAAENLLLFLEDQAEATGVVPDDRTVVVERFRDEIGDWRICVLTPFGARVHAPWAMAIRSRLEAAGDSDLEIMWSNDGIIFRLPESEDSLDLEDLLIEPDEVMGLVVSMLPGSSMFAARFREVSARALLLPRRRPDQRTPLWQQRQRAGNLLSVASNHPTFPMLLETTRECVNDVFDLPALIDLMRRLQDRRVRIVAVDTPTASPFAASLLYEWIAVYMYEGDAPLAERRAAALGLDRNLLRDLLGTDELRSLLDADVIEQVEMELQRRADGRRARSVDEVHDLLRIVGPLDGAEVERRSEVGPAGAFRPGGALEELVAGRRAIEVSMGGRRYFADAADAGRLRDALGVSVPQGLPAAFTDSIDHPLRSLVERHARTRGPFLAAELSQRFGVTVESIELVLEALERDGQVISGEFRPAGVGVEWCDATVMRLIRRRTLASLRRDVEAVEPEVLGRFLPTWQRVGDGVGAGGSAGLIDVVSQLAGAPLVASGLDREILGVRVVGYRPADLDAMCTAGELVWVGAGAIGGRDGRVRLFFRSDTALLGTATGGGRGPNRPNDAHHEVIRALLERRGASFWADLQAAAAEAGLAYDEPTVLAALWDLVWAGEVTNDSIAPLRAVVGDGRAGGRTAAGRRPIPRRPRGRVVGSASGCPPAAAGRWSLVADLAGAGPATESAHALALQLLERYGVLTREMALAEGVEAGFAGVYPVLKAMEEQGQIRRGYFIDGLGAAQFATHAAVDRLRALRRDPAIAATDISSGAGDGEPEAKYVVLAATDPAQPYGAALGWPANAGRPTRSARSRVVLADGHAVVWVDGSGRNIVTFPAAARHHHWVEGVAGLVASGRSDRLEIATVDGNPVATTEWAPAFREAGFADGYRGLVLRAGRR